MIIESLNPVWWLMFGIQLALIVGIWLFGRKKTPEIKRKIMTGLYIFMVAFLVAYKIWLVCSGFEVNPEGDKTSFINELPLNLCQIAALLALPGILLKNRTMTGFCYFVGSICSLMGMLMPVYGFEGKSLFHLDNIGFYGFHGLVFVQSISLLTLGIYKPKYPDIPKLIGLFAGITLLVYGINCLLRVTGAHPTANYFFTHDPEGNAILGFFRGLINVDFIYLLPLLIPVGALFLGEAALLRLILRKRKGDLLHD